MATGAPPPRLGSAEQAGQGQGDRVGCVSVVIGVLRVPDSVLAVRLDRGRREKFPATRRRRIEADLRRAGRAPARPLRRQAPRRARPLRELGVARLRDDRLDHGGLRPRAAGPSRVRPRGRSARRGRAPPRRDRAPRCRADRVARRRPAWRPAAGRRRAPRARHPRSTRPAAGDSRPGGSAASPRRARRRRRGAAGAGAAGGRERRGRLRTRAPAREPGAASALRSAGARLRRTPAARRPRLGDPAPASRARPALGCARGAGLDARGPAHEPVGAGAATFSRGRLAGRRLLAGPAPAGPASALEHVDREQRRPSRMAAASAGSFTGTAGRARRPRAGTRAGARRRHHAIHEAHRRARRGSTRRSSATVCSRRASSRRQSGQPSRCASTSRALVRGERLVEEGGERFARVVAGHGRKRSSLSLRSVRARCRRERTVPELEVERLRRSPRRRGPRGRAAPPRCGAPRAAPRWRGGAPPRARPARPRHPGRSLVGQPQQRLLALPMQPPLGGRQPVQAEPRGDGVEPGRELGVAAELGQARWARRKASWATSSASAALPSIRSATPNTRCWYVITSSSKAARVAGAQPVEEARRVACLRLSHVKTIPRPGSSRGKNAGGGPGGRARTGVVDSAAS